MTSSPRSSAAMAAAALCLASLAGCGPELIEPSSPFAEEIFAAGQRHYLKENYAAAASRFAEYLAFDLPSADEAAGRYWLGRCRLMQGRPREALELFDAALDCPPDPGIAGLVLLGRGDALRALGQLERAEQVYRAIADRSLPSDPADIALARLARCLRERGAQAQADRVMQTLRQRFPRSPALAGEVPGAQPAGRYSVQVGAFGEHTSASALARQLRSVGFDAYLVQIAGRYHVRVGRFHSRKDAEAEAVRLTAAGYSSFIVE